MLALPNYGIKWKTDAISEDILDMSTHTFSDIQFDYVFQALDSFKYPDAQVGYDSTIHTHYFKYNEYYDGINLDLGIDPMRSRFITTIPIAGSEIQVYSGCTIRRNCYSIIRL